MYNYFRFSARRAAERQEKAEEVKVSENVTDAEEAPNDILENEIVVEEAANIVDEDNSVAEDATERSETEINDEFCPNEDYLADNLNDENSVSFRFVINYTVLCKSLESFKRKVNMHFEMSKVEVTHRFFIITGYEQLEKE